MYFVLLSPPIHIVINLKMYLVTISRLQGKLSLPSIADLSDLHFQPENVLVSSYSMGMATTLSDLPGTLRSWASDYQTQGLVSIAFQFVDYIVANTNPLVGRFPDINTAVAYFAPPGSNQGEYLTIALMVLNWLSSCQMLGVMTECVEALEKLRPLQGMAQAGLPALMAQNYQSQEYHGIILNRRDAKNLLHQYKHCQDRTGKLRETSADDFPADDEGQRRLVQHLYEAIIDYDCIIESKIKKTEGQMEDNAQVKQIKALSPFEIELACWRLLERAYDAQCGIVRVAPWTKTSSWSWRHCSNFMERWSTIVDACRSSKGAVKQMLVADNTTRLAADPHRELKTKVSNKKLNANRDLQVRVGLRTLQSGDLRAVTINGKRVIVDKDGIEVEECVPFSEELLARTKESSGSRPGKRSTPEADCIATTNPAKRTRMHSPDLPLFPAAIPSGQMEPPMWTSQAGPTYGADAMGSPGDEQLLSLLDLDKYYNLLDQPLSSDDPNADVL
ncbi:hypothetical protein GQ53DRAFT_823223 [Thozetella sp. PMI_491]|nr:hypothetical protein GQ53DRAFT_823223 [Thozetella sp. PMI_491]